ncbi:uncharacterized protein LOC126575474 [Anopheles aquasalis]|uniref:uncharacterized protein LOC126575474 n=1 Tax=Anopheles aquasalis TaxID=42839 RepID=UPI00215AE3BD|nr:uncharacterized protein LOC126575474 [Anopheles aquasalis]
MSRQYLAACNFLKEILYRQRRILQRRCTNAYQAFSVKHSVTKRLPVTICSDPFLFFLQHFTKECKLSVVQCEPNPDINNLQEDYSILNEIPSNKDFIASVYEIWKNLSDKEREPYRYRSVMAAMFTAKIDQAF